MRFYFIFWALSLQLRRLYDWIEKKTQNIKQLTIYWPISIKQNFSFIFYPKKTNKNDDSSNGRAQRNQAEKNRRDKLNKSVQQLGCHVRPIAGTSKRVDKTAILRLSAHGLRIEYGKHAWIFSLLLFVCSVFIDMWSKPIFNINWIYFRYKWFFLWPISSR